MWNERPRPMRSPSSPLSGLILDGWLPPTARAKIRHTPFVRGWRLFYRRCEPMKNMINMKPTTNTPTKSFRRSDMAGCTPASHRVTVGDARLMASDPEKGSDCPAGEALVRLRSLACERASESNRRRANRWPAARTKPPPRERVARGGVPDAVRPPKANPSARSVSNGFQIEARIGEARVRPAPALRRSARPRTAR
jgi:hypothetical protein